VVVGSPDAARCALLHDLERRVRKGLAALGCEDFDEQGLGFGRSGATSTLREPVAWNDSASVLMSIVRMISTPPTTKRGLTMTRAPNPEEMS